MIHTLSRIYEAMATSTQWNILDLLLRMAQNTDPRAFQVKLKESRDWSSVKVDEFYRSAVATSPLLPKWIDVASILEQKLLLVTLGLPISALKLPAHERVYHLFVIGVSKMVYQFPSLVLGRDVHFRELVLEQWKMAVFDAISAGPLEGPIPLLGGKPPTPKPRPMPEVPAPRPNLSETMPLAPQSPTPVEFTFPEEPRTQPSSIPNFEMEPPIMPIDDPVPDTMNILENSDDEESGEDDGDDEEEEEDEEEDDSMPPPPSQVHLDTNGF